MNKIHRGKKKHEVSCRSIAICKMISRCQWLNLTILFRRRVTIFLSLLLSSRPLEALELWTVRLLFAAFTNAVAFLRALRREPRGVAIVACMPLICIRPTSSVTVSSALPLCVFTTLHFVYACALITSVPEKRAVFLTRFIGDIKSVELNGIK